MLRSSSIDIEISRYCFFLLFDLVNVCLGFFQFFMKKLKEMNMMEGVLSILQIVK